MNLILGILGVTGILAGLTGMGIAFQDFKRHTNSREIDRETACLATITFCYCGFIVISFGLVVWGVV